MKTKKDKKSKSVSKEELQEPKEEPKEEVKEEPKEEVKEPVTKKPKGATINIFNLDPNDPRSITARNPGIKNSNDTN